FNYVVAHIEQNGKDLLLDATDEYLKLGMLPIDCLNGQGLLVHPTKSRLLEIIPTEKDIEFKNAKLVIDEEGEMKGSISKSYGGYGALTERKEFKDKGSEKYLEEAKKENASWVIEKAEYKNTSEYDVPMEAQYQVSLSDYVTKAGNMLYLKPMLSEGKKENALKSKERLYPIDFAFQREETFMATYELPKGYSIVEIPKNISMNLPENTGKFVYVISVNENKLTVTSRIQFRKSVYYAEEYPFLQEFFDKVVAKHSEQVVLKKN
ncbi:MAG TPA: transglutaminase, partial [Emticicia sp.]